MSDFRLQPCREPLHYYSFGVCSWLIKDLPKRRCKAMTVLIFLTAPELPHRGPLRYIIYLADRTIEQRVLALPSHHSATSVFTLHRRRGSVTSKSRAPRTEQRYRKEGGKSSLCSAESRVKKQKPPPGQLRFSGSQKAIQFFGERRSTGADSFCRSTQKE